MKLRRRLAAHLRLGQRGERMAARLLQHLGLEILCRNVVGPHGELDIIARDGDVLCFVEVKARQQHSFARPIDAVTKEKQRHIIATARRYLRHLGRPQIVSRFDVVELIYEGHTVIDARYWPGAFEPD